MNLINILRILLYSINRLLQTLLRNGCNFRLSKLSLITSQSSLFLYILWRRHLLNLLMLLLLLIISFHLLCSNSRRVHSSSPKTPFISCTCHLLLSNLYVFYFFLGLFLIFLRLVLLNLMLLYCCFPHYNWYLFLITNYCLLSLFITARYMSSLTYLRHIKVTTTCWWIILICQLLLLRWICLSWRGSFRWARNIAIWL